MTSSEGRTEVVYNIANLMVEDTLEREKVENGPYPRGRSVRHPVGQGFGESNW